MTPYRSPAPRPDESEPEEVADRSHLLNLLSVLISLAAVALSIATLVRR